MRSMLLLAIFAGCSRPASGSDDPQPQPPEPVRFDKPAMVAFHMRAHFGDLRDIERMLIKGKLDDAKTRAFLLTVQATDAGLARWQREVAEVTEAARSLTTAPGIDEALRREVQVAAACAWCHSRTQEGPVFAEPAAAPRDDGKLAARMARHRWAADRLWEGLVGNSEHHWRIGLDVLASSPPPFPPITDAPGLAAQLQAYAVREIANLPRESLEERTRVYGEMLVVCGACHLERR